MATSTTIYEFSKKERYNGRQLFREGFKLIYKENIRGQIKVNHSYAGPESDHQLLQQNAVKLRATMSQISNNHRHRRNCNTES